AMARVCTAALRHARSGNEGLTSEAPLASSLLHTEIAGGRGQAALADCRGPPGADDGGGGPLAVALGWSRAGGSRVSCATPGCLFGSLLPPSHLIVAVVVVGRPRYRVTATPRSRRGSVSLARKLTTSRRAGRLLTTRPPRRTRGSTSCAWHRACISGRGRGSWAGGASPTTQPRGCERQGWRGLRRARRDAAGGAAES